MLALMGPRKLDLAIATYRDLRPRLVEAAEDFGAAVRAIIDEAGINYLTVESRAKTVESFAVKARRLRERDPDADPMEEITDQVGVRVITYVQSDIPRCGRVARAALRRPRGPRHGPPDGQRRTLRLRQPAPARLP